ncbi:MAG: aldehyde dehydrogenase family protein [Pirellulaceae bacterium]|nr:aldehyde dehydrogenase family protein [Pirellulaceae bacterium]
MTVVETPRVSTHSTITVRNPMDGKVVYSVSQATAEAIQDTMQRSRQAAAQIAAMPIEERVRQVQRLQYWIVENSEFIIDSILAETGKSRFDAFASEVFSVCDVIDVFAKLAPKILADRQVKTPIFLMGKKSRITYQPLGTVLMITPWNYPFYQGIVPTVTAFLAGNAVVLKPSEVTPLKPVWDKLLTESGFCRDALLVVYGGRETGTQLIEALPDKVHFTGSVAAGKKVMAQCAPHLIPVDLELGGKDPGIVFDDVDLERTVNGVLWGSFTTSGQACTSLERLYVQDSIYDAFVKLLVERTKQIRSSTPGADTSRCDSFDMGTITAPYQIATIENHISEAVSQGAKLLCGGPREHGSHHIPPTVVADVTHAMKLGREETFGPVVAVMRFSTEQEAIRLANESSYGLGASVWSRDLVRAVRVAKALKTGNVSINNHMITQANPWLPFGGVKHSGFGRLKGEHGLLGFCNVKSIGIDKQGSKIDSHWYPFTKEKYQLMSNMLKHYFGRRRSWIRFLASALRMDSMGKKQKFK